MGPMIYGSDDVFSEVAWASARQTGCNFHSIRCVKRTLVTSSSCVHEGAVKSTRDVFETRHFAVFYHIFRPGQNTSLCLKVSILRLLAHWELAPTQWKTHSRFLVGTMTLICRMNASTNAIESWTTVAWASALQTGCNFHSIRCVKRTLVISSSCVHEGAVKSTCDVFFVETCHFAVV